MFVPEGYVPLLFVKHACCDIANERFPPVPSDDADSFFKTAERDPRAVLYSELILRRFIEHYCEELFVFQYPSTLLRAPAEIFFEDRIYDGPCPKDINQAQSGIEHLRASEIRFFNDEVRIDADFDDGKKPLLRFYGLERFVEDAKALHGAILCWKSCAKLKELTAILGRFRDQEYWLGLHPDYPCSESEPEKGARDGGLWNAYICFQEQYPNGKEAANATWAEVERTVGYSRRQILRAVKKFGG